MKQTQYDLDDLAKLDVLEYERVRKEAARVLQIRTATLDHEVEKRRRPPSRADEIKPWHAKVDGIALLNELEETVKRHVILSGEEAIAAALWIVHAHAHDAGRFSPILALYSPTRGCGKTTLLSTIALLVPKPLAAANVTNAAMFRSIELWHPTLLIDEADTFIEKNDDMRGILNSGHIRNVAFVLRCEGDKNEPKPFSTWAPKAMALMGKRLHAALEDRSVIITLRRKLKKVGVAPLPKENNAYDDLRRKCARWALDHAEQLAKARPRRHHDMGDRANDNWEPLFAIADACGGEWPADAREAALSLSKTEEQDVGIMLLEDLRAMFEEVGGNLSSEQIATKLNTMEDRPWPEYTNGKPITTRQIAKLLQPFNVKPRQVRVGLHNEDRRKGYMPDQFKSAFERYLRSLSHDGSYL